MVGSMWIRLLPGLCCLSIGLTAGVAQSQASPSHRPPSPAQVKPAAPPLEDDTRLNAVVDVQAVGITLPNLLKQVAPTSLTLKTDSLCAEQKIQLSLHKRPLRTLMQSLATLLPGTWEPLADKSGYILRMSPVAAHRRDKWWALFLQEREQQLAALRAAVLEAMRTPPHHRKPDDPNPEHSDPGIEAQIASQKGFFNALSPGLQESIANNLNEMDLIGGGLGFCEEEAVQVPFNDLSPAAQEGLRNDPDTRFFTSRHDVNWNDVMVRFNNTGGGVMSSIALPGGLASSTPLVSTPFEKSLTLLLDHRQLADVARRLERAAPATWKPLLDTWRQFLTYQNSRVWPNAAPQHPPRSSPPHRADVLRRLGEENNIEYVADYYSTPGYPLSAKPVASTTAAPKEPLPTPTLEAELDDAAALLDISWKKQAVGIYLFRNNRWYRDDLLEIPDALAKRWTAQWAKPGTERRRGWKTAMTPDDVRAQMDWEADVVSNLTLWQIGSGLQWLADENCLADIAKHPPVYTSFDPRNPFPFMMQTARILGEYHTTSFYAGLGREQRDALIAGRLPFAALTAPQQQQALKLAPRLRSLLTDNAAPVLLGLFSNVGNEPIDMNNMPRVRLTATFAPLR